PEMADPAVAREVLEMSKEAAQVLCPGDPNMAAQMAQNPQFWKFMFFAGRAVEAHNEEDANAPSAVLESGSGARPGAFEGDVADQIFGAPSATKSLSFLK